MSLFRQKAPKTSSLTWGSAPRPPASGGLAPLNKSWLRAWYLGTVRFKTGTEVRYAGTDQVEKYVVRIL